MPATAPIREFLDDRHLEVAAGIEDFTADSVAGLAPADDDAAARAQAGEILELLGAAGWCRWAVPAADGGAAEDVDLRACCLIREALAAASPLADAVFALQCLGAMPLVLAGSEELRSTWLPRAAAGAAMMAFAMTETGAGSDVSSIATAARRDGNDYVLSGRKTLISNAGIADVYTVFARSGESGGRPEISAFVVPATAAGLRFVGPQVLSEPHPLGEIELDACRVPATARLGAAGDGYKLGMRTLDRLRASVAAAACGMAARALAEAVEHAKERRQFGAPLADFQIVREKLAVMATELAAARLLTYRAAAAADRGAERVTLESAMAKAYATEAAQRIVDAAVQIVGGRGVLAGHPVDRLYRAVRALRIYEGATEIQHLVIASQLLRD